MRRRQFVHALAGLTAAAFSGVTRATVDGATRAASPRRRIGVVGGGIVGAAIAWRLAEAGADVVQFERTAPAAGATRNSFGWLNAFVADRHYQALRLASVAAYRELDQSLGLGITWGGYLNWARSEAEAATVSANAAQLAGTAFPTRSLTAAEFASLSPSIAPGPIAAALYSALDGHIDPVHATLRFLAQAQRHGARMQCPCEVQGLDLQAGRLRSVQTSCGAVALDRLVVATGVDTPRLLAMAGFDLRLRHAPGFLAHSTPAPLQVRSICDAPGGLEFKQMVDGTLVGTDSPEPPDIPVHEAIRAGALEFPDDAIRALHGNRALDKIRAFLPGAQGARLDHVTLGFRPMPTDGFPVVGRVPGAPDLYVAVTHSGVTLAPILAVHVRSELLHEREVGALAPYRPGRFVQDKAG
jgi:glycine/D-amino acid oxidase-like deaminating enzyme